MGNTKIARHVLLLMLVLTLPLFVAADDPATAGPRSAKAKAAIKKYDRAVERAKADYDRAVAAAGKELKGELDVALKASMKAGSLDEAKRIERAMSGVAAAAGGEADEPEPKLATPKHLLGRWVVTAGDNRWPVYLKSNHLVLYDDPNMIAVWVVRDNEVAISSNAGIIDSFKLSDDPDATELTGVSSRGTPLKLVRP